MRLLRKTDLAAVHRLPRSLECQKGASACRVKERWDFGLTAIVMPESPVQPAPSSMTFFLRDWKVSSSTLEISIGAGTNKESAIGSG